jgi:SAM-dependent methyltransferase
MSRRGARKVVKISRGGCRLCGGRRLSTIVTLPDMPVSHAFRRGEDDPDPRFDIAFKACARCGLLQIVEVVEPQVLYRDTDSYTTSFQQPRHLDDLITTAVAHQDPGQVIDIGCNDGALMDALKRHGYGGIVGVEPIKLAAQQALNKGHVVYTDFFGGALADRILQAHGPFEALYLRHVAEHIDSLDEFFQALRKILQADGLLIMELPQVECGLMGGNAAVLWEEHVNYFTEPLAEYLLRRYGFKILERRRYAFGGGAIAFVARKVAMPRKAPLAPNPAATLRLVREFNVGLGRYRDRLRSLVVGARAAGYKVVMYGAAPRSCVVASACGIGSMIDVVIDDRSDIQGRLMPGTQRPVLALDSGLAQIDGAPTVCLLGVGAENEFKVRAKLAAGLRSEPPCVSLFPPRDTLRSIAAAAAAIEAK